MGKVTQACWEKAGSRELSVAAAAATTNVLLVRTLSHIHRRIQDDETIGSANTIASRIQAISCNHHTDPLTLHDELKDTLDYLIDSESAISSSRAPKASQTTPTMPNSEASLVHRLLAEIKNLPNHENIPSLMLDGLSSIAVLGPYGNETSALASATCLYLLTTSHSAYSCALERANQIALPRISSLKLANEALATINKFIDDKTIFPCQCMDTLGYRVAQMKNELECYARYRSWDCLMQNPLVAGNHILEILDVCSYYGLHLIHYRQWTAAVLHSYQALVVLGYLNKVPMLEEICDLLAPVLYTTGERPASGFMASWLRYIGARLKFRKGKKYQDHKDTWCMAVPAHIAARSAGLNIRGRNESVVQPKFDYGTIDLTMRTKHAGWTLQDEVAADLDSYLGLSSMEDASDQVLGLPLQLPPSISKSRAAKHKRSKSCQEPRTSASPSDHSCLKPDHILDASFSIDEAQCRSIPACKLNLLSLFHNMTQVIAGISDATHANESSGAGRDQMCLCFTQTILRAADRVQDVRKRGGLDAKGAVLSKNEKECVECYKNHLMKILGKADVLEGHRAVWLWTSM